ncbi:MAG: cation transporter [Rhodospirillaceae bacterium]|nr:MAG: cation transporter [Rhodospirillaceae bacterium]
MLHTISLGAGLAALWMLLSGYFEPLMLGFGLASIIFTLWIAHRMDVVDHEGHPVHLAFHALMIYWPWLFWQIIKSNIDMAKVILSPKLNITPHTFDTQSSQSSDVGRVLYANSITLTPGTVTVDMRADGMFEVHALTKDAREGVETLDMDRRCTAMVGELQSTKSSDSIDSPDSPSGDKK